MRVIAAKLIDDLNRDSGKAVYYLLYNPHQMPCSVSYPLRQRIRIDDTAAGCRVVDARAFSYQSAS